MSAILDTTETNPLGEFRPRDFQALLPKDFLYLAEIQFFQEAYLPFSLTPFMTKLYYDMLPYIIPRVFMSYKFLIIVIYYD